MEKQMNFKRNHEYLICLDSDGCAIDGMTVKHIRCFGPCAIEEWKMQQHQEELLNYWNQVNLYTLSRGINRFKGLLLLLQYMQEKGYIADDITNYENWVTNTPELSNASLKREMEKQNGQKDRILQKALSWSDKVNAAVRALLEEDKLAFKGVRDALVKAHLMADVVVVSAANAQAVADEWNFNDLMDQVDFCMTQEYGSKTECIDQLRKAGNYDLDKVLMIGDSLGDFESAQKNQVLFFPILAGKETESWKIFQNSVLDLFLNGAYDQNIMQKYLEEFRQNLQ